LSAPPRQHPGRPWNHPVERDALPCFRDDHLDLTYGQFAQRVEALAGQLADRGVGPGDVVAVMLPNRAELVLAIFAAWRLGAAATPINPAFTVTEAILPLFHVNAILVSVLSPMLAGAQITVMGKFAPEPFLQLIEQRRPTYFSGVPTIYALLAALPEDVIPDTSSLRFAVCGAAPVSKELLERSEERFGFVMIEGYGLTEGTCCSACNPIHGPRKLGTVGPALGGQQIAIVSEDGELLPTGSAGEVIITGPTVMRGYLGKPEATAETIRDGWLHTGDVGHLDEDGYLTLVDRIKDMIIRGGENLYPKTTPRGSATRCARS
jgi:acyl-CoA synthetase (AMP-forming)/AMP-acid ligase II